MTTAQPINTNALAPNYTQFNQIYSADGIKFIMQRQCEYLRERPYGTLNGRLMALVPVATGGFLGYWVAANLSKNFESGKEKIAFQCAGVTVGAAAGFGCYMTINEKNLFFKTWKFLKLSLTASKTVFKNHQDDQFLNLFTGFITYETIQVPVRLSDGKLIDLNVFKTIHPNENGDTLCPFTRKKLDLDNPHIALELYTLILKRAQHLLKQDLENIDPETDESTEVKLQLEVVEKLLRIAFEKHLTGLINLRSEGKITDEDFSYLQNQFSFYFGTNPIGNANPQYRTPAHEMNFNLDWKNILIDHDKIMFKGMLPMQFAD